MTEDELAEALLAAWKAGACGRSSRNSSRS